MKTPYKLTVIQSFGEGRGGIVKMPIAKVTEGVILGNTAGGGTETVDFDLKAFNEVVENFDKKPGPVSVYPGHIPKADRREKPAWGNVRDVWVEGDMLVGSVQLTPTAWKAVVEDAGFYGSSGEFDVDKTIATGTLDGWVLNGLAITNTPALDVFYAVEFSEAEGRKHMRFSSPIFPAAEAVGLDRKGRDMITLEALQADKVRLEAEVADLKKKNEELSTRPTRAEFETLQQKVQATETEATKTKVVALCEKAMSEGVRPAFFEGFDKDPIKFLNDRFGGSVASLEATLACVPRDKVTGNVGTGARQEPGGSNDDPQAKFLAEVRAVVAEKKVAFGEAYEIVRATKPDLFKAASAATVVKAQQ